MATDTGITVIMDIMDIMDTMVMDTMDMDIMDTDTVTRVTFTSSIPKAKPTTEEVCKDLIIRRS